jgi:hypothetical protein
MTARLRVLSPALLVAILVLSSSALAQSRRTITGEGTEGFRALLAGKGLAPIQNFEEFERVGDPKQILIVAFRGANEIGEPAVDALEHPPFGLKQFVVDGGALFIATDQPTDADWQGDFGTRVARVRHITRAGVVPRAQYLYASGFRHPYAGKAECPYTEGVRGADPALFVRRGDDLRSLKVATNKPTYLVASGNRAVRVLGEFPAWTWSTEPLGAAKDESRDFAHGMNYRSGGKFLLLSDHSVFINSMLLPHGDPNDNLAFASNCVDWLMTADGGQPRRYVMFIEDGKIWQKDDYNLILQSLPGGVPEDIAQFLWENRELLWKNTDFAEAVLDHVENTGILDEIDRSGALATMAENLFEPWMIARVLLVLGGVALLGYGAMRFMGSRFRFPKRVARISMVLDRLRPRSGLLELRVRSGLGRGQYYELARQKAREMFAELKLTPAAEGPMPTVEINAGWLRRGRIMRDLRAVWAVAFAAQPVPVTARQWSAWNKKLDQIEVMIRHGAIRFG